MKILVLISVVTFSQAQLTIDSVPQKPWTGPLADHQIGIHPSDTPEVAAAKNQHLKAFQDVLAVLPELPPEERYIMDGLPLPAIRALQERANLQQLNYVQHIPPVIQTQSPYFQIPQHVVEVQATPTVPTVFAEEIPRSPIGEVPEVHAARVAHLKAVQEARAGLTPLTI